MNQPFPKIVPVDPFEMFMAKIAGQKIVINDAGCTLVAYAYKGKIYVASFTQPT